MSSWFRGAGRGSLLLVGALGALVACGASDDDATGEMAGAGGSAAEGVPDALSFEAPTMTMAPGEVRELTLHIHPAGEYRVRVSLLGDSADASLDRTDIVSAPNGEATVLLTAPTGPRALTFTVRAAVGQTVVTETDVSIASQGTAALEVKPIYRGTRTVTAWVASARPGVTCAELSGTPPADGDLYVETTANFVPVLDVPAGRDLAVTVRGDEQVAGCLDLPPLAVNEARTVEVTASNVPIRLDGFVVETVVDLSQPEPGWTTLASAALERCELALLNDATNDVDALLQAMTAIGKSQNLDVDLAVARERGGWDGALVSQFGVDVSDTVLRGPLREWFALGAQRLSQSAPLVATLEPTADIRDRAILTPLTFAGLPAQELGFPEEVLVTWIAEPNDEVLLGASFGWHPWMTFVHLAERQVPTDGGETERIAAGLLAAVDCDATAANLHERALSEMGSCNKSCLASVCEAAVTALWERGSDVAATDPGWVDLSVAAQATVDSAARLTEFTGEWVGTLDTGIHEAQASGEAEGWALADDSATQ